jgi:two-component system alkaline phosphatase synthesis response regulator PhoP
MATKILAVDDAPDVRRLIQIKLKKEGFEVLTAVNGQEGVEVALAEKPDVVLMDVMMPKMDGFTAVREIRAQTKEAPVILMLTAKGSESDVMEGLSGGADDYIVKPFAPRELVSRIKVALIKAGKPVDVGDQE